MKRTLPILGLCFCISAVAATTWTPEFSMQVQTVGAVVPSPDGQWIAYTQTKAVAEAERSEQVSQIYLARADGSRAAAAPRSAARESGATFPAAR